MEKDNRSVKRNIAFSPPDVGVLEATEVAAAICSGWITTGACEKIGTCISCGFGISDGYKLAS